MKRVNTDNIILDGGEIALFVCIYLHFKVRTYTNVKITSRYSRVYVDYASENFTAKIYIGPIIDFIF